MIKLGKEKTKSLVTLHGWSAVSLGFLLYAVVITGTVAVFAEEIRHWSIGNVKHENPLKGDVDSIVRSLAADVDPEFLEDIGIGASERGNLELFFHAHRKTESGQIEEYGTQFEIDPVTGDRLGELTGTPVELRHAEQGSALSHFLVETHVQLHLPAPWGLLLTGILGLAMMVAAVSGFMMHRHLFTDIFVLRRDRSATTVKRDVHTVAGTWGLPFAFILAFTGSFFSFAGSFGIPAMAMVAFGGDQEKMIRTVIGAPETESDTFADMADLNVVIADAVERSETPPRFISLSHYGKDNAGITLFIPPAETKLEDIQLEYNGVSGEFIRERPPLGIVPSAGSAVFSLIGPLHFGHFAGWLSKIVWVALGFASCYVILTGFDLWVERRRKSSNWLVFERFVSVFGLGLPVAMLVAGVGYFLAAPLGVNTGLAVPWSFCIASVLCILAGAVVTNGHRLKCALLWLCAALCILLPLVRMITGGQFWVAAIQSQQIAVVVIDWLLLGFGLFSVQRARKQLLRVNDGFDPVNAGVLPKSVTQ